MDAHWQRRLLREEPDHASAITQIKQIPPERFEAGAFDSLLYRLLPPLKLVSGQRYPLVIVLHGAGEMGTDNLKHMDLLVKSWAQEERRKKFPTFVLAPQMPTRSAFYDLPPADPRRRSRPGPPLTVLLALVDSLVKTLPIDSRRIDWVGYSMGASTTWNALVLRPDLFTAGVVYCGVPTGLPLPVPVPPIWMVNGSLDEINPTAPTRTVFESLRQQNAPVRLWEYDDLGHWPPADLLVGESIPQWFMS